MICTAWLDIGFEPGASGVYRRANTHRHIQRKGWRMKVKGLVLVLSLVVVAGMVRSVDAVAAPRFASTTVVQESAYGAGSADLEFITDWIVRRSPAHAPMLPLGAVTVRHTFTANARDVRLSRPNGPPVPLPSSGREGEELTITSRSPDGGVETWGYTWHDQGWVLVEYHFKGPNNTNSPPLGG